MTLYLLVNKQKQFPKRTGHNQTVCPFRMATGNSDMRKEYWRNCLSKHVQKLTSVDDDFKYDRVLLPPVDTARR